MSETYRSPEKKESPTSSTYLAEGFGRMMGEGFTQEETRSYLLMRLDNISVIFGNFSRDLKEVMTHHKEGDEVPLKDQIHSFVEAIYGGSKPTVNVHWEPLLYSIEALHILGVEIATLLRILDRYLAGKIQETPGQTAASGDDVRKIIEQISKRTASVKGTPQ